MFSLRNLHYHHSSSGTGDETVVRGIEVAELDIAAQGVTAIIGPSGSGKTTLLSVLAGFLQPETGPDGGLTFAGHALPATGHRPGQVAFVFQSSLLLGAATGLTNALQGHMAARAADPDRRLDPAYMRRLLRKLGLTQTGKHLIARRARHLSGGEAQRVAILRALLTDPQAILCDEPTSSLDAANAEAAMGALRDWAHSRQRPVIWVTHTLDQAARYADHFVFVAGGRIATAPPEVTEALASPDTGMRLAALQAMSEALTPAPAQTAPTAGDAQPPDPGPLAYAHWIAAALSSDGATADLIERERAAALAPARERGWLSALTTDLPGVPNRLARLLARAVSYSRYALVLILLVLTAQIFAAGFFGALAQRYAQERLDDPAVARIVFEHVIGPRLSGQEAAALYPGAGLQAVETALAEALARAQLDPARARVFGRRSIANSALRFPDATQACQGWQGFDTVALSRFDPLLRQTGLRPDPAPMTSDIAEIASGTGTALLDARIVDVLRTRCGLPGDQPIRADWAAGQAGTLDPVTLTIVGAIADPPPLYPVSADLMVFEDDYQAAANLQDGAAPDPFRIATAYFPIDGFETARQTIEGLGYRIRDDSAAAVNTLRRIARAANDVPRAVMVLNATGCVVVLILVIGGLLDLNKRVFALFQAHGFRLRDILAVLAIHLAPALLYALILLALGLLVLWPGLARALPQDLGDLAALRNAAFVQTLGITILAMTLTTAVVVTLWWHQTRSRLTRYLQE
ncbi:MAG: ATP-binding cassette domain-containing protein [Pseudomonadota bacterium]